MRILTTMLALAAPVLASAADAQPAAGLPPLSDFARFSDYSDPSISPDGQFVVARRYMDGQDLLHIIRLADMVPVASMRLAGNYSIGEYWWVGPQRIAAQVVELMGSKAQAFYTGQIVAQNADGTQFKSVFGGGTGVARDSRIKTGPGIEGVPYRVTTPVMDPKHTPLAIAQWTTSRYGGHHTVLEMDTITGASRKLTVSPFSGISEFLADYAGKVRYVSGTGVDLLAQAWYRLDEDSDWVKANAQAPSSAIVTPLAFSLDGSKVYLSSDETTGDLQCLVEHTLATNQRRALACDPEADLERAIFSFDGTRPIGAVFAPGKPKVVLLDPEDKDAKLLAAIMRSFPGQVVLPVSTTTDGRLAVLAVYSDVNPGDYYLFDTTTKKAQYLVKRNSWIDPAKQAPTQAFTMKSRAGQTLHGFLTLPRGATGKVPLVVMPHGGPIARSDAWEWDAETQALASRGYGVLKVNFRGSDGYGYAFREAGARAWGTGMIDDITDAARWAVAQGHADGNRLCIYGASYGGYAALMSAVREPDLYKCAIGLSGMYDLVAVHRETGRSQLGTNWHIRYMGEDTAELRAQSPIAYLDRLKAAVMIAHGKEDKVVPFNQAKDLRDALEDREYPHEWMAVDNEMHGFNKVENREELLKRVLAFLDRHIGAPAAP